MSFWSKYNSINTIDTIYFNLTHCIGILFPNISGLHYIWLSKKSKIHKNFNACLVMYFLRRKKTVVSIIWNGKNDILSTQKFSNVVFRLTQGAFMCPCVSYWIFICAYRVNFLKSYNFTLQHISRCKSTEQKTRFCCCCLKV